MTTVEMEKILHAYNEGKSIQYYSVIEKKWIDINNPMWNFSNSEYRIKPEPKIRPYNSAKEFLEASREHGPYLYNLSSGTYYMPTMVNDSQIIIADNFNDSLCKTNYYYSEVSQYMRWQDGTKCGIIEE